MKALVKYGELMQYGDYKIEDVPEPVCGDDDVMIEVKAAAICGSDMRHFGVYNGWTEFGSVRGHEFSGQIVQVGKNVTDWKVGQRVVSDVLGHVCGKCPACLEGEPVLCSEAKSYGLGFGYNGGFTKYVLFSGDLLKRHPMAINEIPENVSYEEAAMLDPMSNGFKAMAQESKLLPGDNVVVFGAGALGLSCIMMAKMMGANHIILAALPEDLEGNRGRVAKEQGATDFVNVLDGDVAAKCREICGGKDKVDIVVDCAGAPSALEAAINTVRNNGQVIKVGVNFQPINFHLNQLNGRSIELKGHQGFNMISIRKTLDLMGLGKIDVKPWITHKLGLSEWEKGFELMKSKDAIRVVFHYDFD